MALFFVLLGLHLVQALLPAHFHCHLLGRHQTSSEAGQVWQRLKGFSTARADVTCCSVDKVKSIMEYAELVLSFKVRTMDQQLEFANQVEEGLRRSRSDSPCQPLMRGRFHARLKALKEVALPLGRKGIELQRKAMAMTLRSHCLKPRGIVARSHWSAKLRGLARRFARILRAMEAAAEELMASDAQAIHQGRQGQGREELLKCFQLPLVAGVVGVKLPKSHEKIWADAVAYPFQRPQGSVRTWHVWVDRFSMVFSRLLAKLVYQLKILSASLDFAFLKGSGSLLFWGDERLLTVQSTEGSFWHWPNHLRGDETDSTEHLLDISDLSVLSFIISNQTPREMVERLWSAAVQMLEASERLQLLLIEDAIRQPSETIYRPTHSVDLSARCRFYGNGARMVWRRHHSTLSNADVVAMNLGRGQQNPNDVKAVKVLMIDARESRSSFQTDLDDLLMGKFSTDAVRIFDRSEFGVSYNGYVHGLTGDFVRRVQDTARQSFQETLESLGPYLEFHRRAVEAWGRTVDGSAKARVEKNQFRALIYVCNPLTLCGGHGDRTNGILSAFLIALLTSRAFFIDFDSPLPLSLVLQPRLRGAEASGDFVLDWRLQGASLGHGSQSFYLDDRVSFQEDLTWLVEDSSQILQLSMNHRELQAVLAHPLLKSQAEAYGLPGWPHLVARLWDVLFQPTPLLQRRLSEATDTLGLSAQLLPWTSQAHAAPGFLALHFRAGNESGRLWWDPARHTLDTLPKFLSCAAVVEKEVGLPASTPWFLSSDTFSALELPEVKELQERGKLVVLDDDGTGERTWHLAHVDRSHANLGLQGFVDSYVAYLLLASAKAVVLSRSFFGETAAEIGAVPHVYFAEGCVRADIHSS